MHALVDGPRRMVLCDGCNKVVNERRRVVRVEFDGLLGGSVKLQGLKDVEAFLEEWWWWTK